MNIQLHIERLILDGLSVEQRHRGDLKAAVEAELTRLLTANGLRAELFSSGALRTLGAAEIQLTGRPAAPVLGKQIAQAVHGGIGAEAGGGVERHRLRRENRLSPTLLHDKTLVRKELK